MTERDEDDDTLRADYDLDAWQPPALPDLADAVVARMREPAGHAALETVATEERSRSRSRPGAALGLGAVAVGALVTYLVMRAPASGTTPDPVAGAPETDAAPRSVDDTDLEERRALRVAVDHLQAELETCSNGTAHAPTPVELVVDVLPEGKLEIRRLAFDPTNPAGSSECIGERVTAARFAPTRLGARFEMSFQVAGACDPAAWSRAADQAFSERRIDDGNALKKVADACDDDPAHHLVAGCDDARLVEEGDALFGKGEYAGALARYSAALACRSTPRTTDKAFAAACNARDERRARELYLLLAPERRRSLAQICVRNGIAIEP